MRQVIWQRNLDGQDLSGDYRDSYAGECSLRGCKLGDLRNATLYKCDLTDAEWNKGLARDVYIVDCTLTDLTLPPDMGFIGTPMIQERLRQYAQTQTGARKDGVEKLMTYLDNPLVSWADAAPYFANRPGIKDVAIEMAQECFGRWPHILRHGARNLHLEQIEPFTTEDLWTDPPDGPWVRAGSFGLVACDEGIPYRLYTPEQLPTPEYPHDRYDIERKIEAKVKQDFPGLDDVLVHIRALPPRPLHAVAILQRWLQDTQRWDWWNEVSG